MIQTVRMFGAFPLSFSSVVFLYFSSEPLVARAAAGCRYKVPFTTELVFYAARYFYRFAKCRPGQKPKGVEPPYRRVYMCTVRCVSCACVCVCAFFPFCTPFEKPALAGQGKKTPLQTASPFWATLLNNKARCSKHVRGSNALPSFPLSWLFAFFGHHPVNGTRKGVTWGSEMGRTSERERDSQEPAGFYRQLQVRQRKWRDEEREGDSCRCSRRRIINKSLIKLASLSP